MHAVVFALALDIQTKKKEGNSVYYFFKCASDYSRVFQRLKLDPQFKLYQAKSKFLYEQNCHYEGIVVSLNNIFISVQHKYFNLGNRNGIYERFKRYTMP